MEGFNYDDPLFESNDTDWSVPISMDFSVKEESVFYNQQYQEQPVVSDVMTDIGLDGSDASGIDVKLEPIPIIEAPGPYSPTMSSVSSGSAANSPSSTSSSSCAGSGIECSLPVKSTVRSNNNSKKLSPLPEGCELPAVLGGEMPARQHRNMATGHVPKNDEDDSDSEERRLVRLPRSTLLQISTPQMNQYQRFLMGRMKLSQAQIDEIRKQKKLIKNRESATRIRQKRAKTLSEITAENRVLKEQLDRLTDENNKLRLELSWYHEHSPIEMNAAYQHNSSRTVRMPAIFFWSVLLCLGAIAPMAFFQSRNNEAAVCTPSEQMSRTFTEADAAEIKNWKGFDDNTFVEAGAFPSHAASQWRPQGGLGYLAVRSILPCVSEASDYEYSEGPKLGLLVTGSMLRTALENSTISSTAKDLLASHGDDIIDVQCSVNQVSLIRSDSAATIPTRYLPGYQQKEIALSNA